MIYSKKNNLRKSPKSVFGDVDLNDEERRLRFIKDFCIAHPELSREIMRTCQKIATEFSRSRALEKKQ